MVADSGANGRERPLHEPEREHPGGHRRGDAARAPGDAAATSAASSFGLAYESSRTPGTRKATAGTTIAVSIAAGTKRSARAISGGIGRRANSAMNDSRDR